MWLAMSVEEDMKCIGYMYIIIRPTGLPTKSLMKFFPGVPGIEAGPKVGGGGQEWLVRRHSKQRKQKARYTHCSRLE